MSENKAGGSAADANSLCYLTASEAIKRFKTRDLSPVELLDAVIARTEAVNPKVNAYTETFFERARTQAREAETKYMKGGDVRPLEGVPCVFKDLHPIKGEVVTWGSKVYEGAKAEFTIPTVQRLLDAGVIRLATTTTPEFGHAGHCHTPLFGATRNPWNLEYSSGGSSGGAGAAVAAGMTTLADGSDGGGSVRIPASACGVFGFKPPFGRNPTCLTGSNIEMILHFGPIARSVADAALMQNVMSGPEPTDIMSINPELRLPERFEGIKGWKIAYSPDLGYFEVDKEVAANTRAALDALRDLGCEVEEVDLGWNMGTMDAWTTHWEALFATLCGDYLPRWQYEMDPFVRGLLQRGLEHSAVRLKRTELVRTEMYNSLGPILQKYNALVCPTLAVPSIPAFHQNDDPNFKINGKPVHPYIQWAMTYPFNLVSQCPVASIPTGFAKSGVPTGMQIVAKPFDDLSVFRVAAAFEAARPWAGVAPAL